jgi:hypothetical protein
MGSQTASAHLLSPRKYWCCLVWFTKISADAAETAPTETTTAFRGLLNRPGVSLHSTTSDHLVVLEGLRTTDTQSSAVPVSVVTGNARL